MSLIYLNIWLVIRKVNILPPDPMGPETERSAYYFISVGLFVTK